MLFSTSLALGQTKIVVSEPKQKLAIAIEPTCASVNTRLNLNNVSGTLSKDLELSGFFNVLLPQSYSNRVDCRDANVDYRDWRSINAQWLVRSVVEGAGGGLAADFYLYDVSAARRVLGKRYTGKPSDLPVMAHRFANAIIEYLTGTAGPFGSQIAFSARIGRFKELFVMDLDGGGLRQLTRDKGLALSPAWNSRGDRLLYTSYKTRQPDLYLMELPSGISRIITKSKTLEVGGDFSPDGRFVITSISGEGRDSDLAIFDTRGQIVRRFGQGNRSIDVSPSLSPDGEQVAFCSDRGGSPQIYVMPLKTGQARRVSYVKSSYCTSPDWAPRGDSLAFVCRVGSKFQVFVSKIDGSQALQVTNVGDNEDPSWSPDGRYVAFASTFGESQGYDIAMARIGDKYEATQIKRLTHKRGDETEPDWGPAF
jgi:TolB protein